MSDCCLSMFIFKFYLLIVKIILDFMITISQNFISKIIPFIIMKDCFEKVFIIITRYLKFVKEIIQFIA